MWFIIALLALLGVASAVMLFKTSRGAWFVLVTLFISLGLAVFFAASWGWYLGIVVVAIALMYVAMRREEGKPTGRLTAGVVVLAIIAVALAMFGTPSLPSTPKAETVTGTTPNDETIKALTIKTAAYKCAVISKGKSKGLVAYDIGALKGAVKNERKWRDSPSTMIVEKNSPTKMVNEIKATICKDPHYGTQVANFFANLKLGKFEVASKNPWLNEFKGTETTTVNTKAADYVPTLNVTNLTDEKIAEAVKKNKEWQVVASKVNALLSQFTVGTVETDTSVRNYHLLGSGPVVGNLPASGINDKQTDNSAVQLSLTQKGTTECLAKIGFGTDDKRLMEFKCPAPAGA